MLNVFHKDGKNKILSMGDQSSHAMKSSLIKFSFCEIYYFSYLLKKYPVTLI